MKQPLGVILAGGLSSRMGGGDKALMKLGNKSLLTHVIDRIEPQVKELAINANSDEPHYHNLGYPVIADNVAGHPGPLAGILAGLDWAASRGADHIVTVAADTPFFPADLVPRLLLAAEMADTPTALAVTPDLDRGIARHPTFGLWRVDLRDDLRGCLADGMRRVVLWARRNGTIDAEFPVGRFDPFFNVNTPEDLVRAEKLHLGAES